MKRHGCILVLILLLFGQAAFAQEDGFWVRGIILNSATNLPLDNVNISLLGNYSLGTSSDSLGRFSFKVFQLPATLNFSHIGYEDKIVEFPNNSKLLKIQLSPISIPLPEIAVSAERKIDTVFHQPLNVVDYIFKGDTIILLIYKNIFEKYQLAVLDRNESVIATLSLLDYRPSSLFKSCIGQIFLTTDIGTFTILAEADSIALAQQVDDDFLMEVIQPCAFATDSFLYFGRYFYQGQALQYFGFSKSNKLQKVIFPMIQHLKNIDLLIEETGTRFPISGNVWQKDVSHRLVSLREAPYSLKGMMGIFYPKLYAPIAKYDSLLCIFNHSDSEIQFFKEDGIMVSSTPIQYHRLKKWSKTLFFDEINETAYTTFDTKWGNQICSIDMNTGALGNAIPINRDFIDKLKIHDGHLYFLYRNPYHGAQNRMLQKMRLD